MRFLLPVIILGLAIAGAGWLMNNNKPAFDKSTLGQEAASKPARPFVRTQVFAPAAWDLPVHLSGIVSPKQKVGIISEADGRLVYKNPRIQTSELVKKGDVLFRIESPALRNQLLAAQSTVHQAQQALIQTQAQVETAGEVPGLKTPLNYREQLLRTQRAILTAAQADLKLANTYFDRQTIVAPFDGRVVGLDLNTGQILSVGTELAQIYSPTQMQVEIGLNSDNATLLQRQDVAIHDVKILVARGRGQKFDYFNGGLVSNKGSIDPVTGLETLKIDINEDVDEQRFVNQTAFLMPGERVDVRLSIPASEPLLRLPLSAAPNDEALGILTTAQYDGEMRVAKVVRQHFDRVYSDRQYGYFRVPAQETFHLIDQPPAWLMPGHEVKIKAPQLQAFDAEEASASSLDQNFKDLNLKGSQLEQGS